ncbi:hypothetical protein CB1_001207012 [Camelus ferus]|nr:hypothetical protein CB1_001207012 [Camelus ferus]
MTLQQGTPKLGSRGGTELGRGRDSTRTFCTKHRRHGEWSLLALTQLQLKGFLRLLPKKSEQQEPSSDPELTDGMEKSGTTRRETSLSGSATSPVGLLTDLCDYSVLNSLERSRPSKKLSVTADGFPELELPLLAAQALRNSVRNYFPQECVEP